METTIQDRRRFNEEIERIVMLCMDYASEFETYDEMERGMALLDLYEHFYRSFSRLLRYTGNLSQMSKSQPDVEIAWSWIHKKESINDDKKLAVRLRNGVRIFDAYHKVLAAQGVIAPPQGGR